MMERNQVVLTATALLSAILISVTYARDPAPEVAFRSMPGKVVITIGGEPFATYSYEDPDIPRPYFAHVKTPSGVQATRNHPPVKGRDRTDHITIHPGVWLAFGDISGNDYWRKRAEVRHEAFIQKPRGGPGSGSFVVRNEYLSVDGKKTVCIETCRHTILARSSGYYILYDSVFSSEEADFYFGDQEEMGLGIRVNSSITVKDGGRITNSDGLRNEKQVWGKQADWCDYGGDIGETCVGMTLMPAPSNFRRSWFHARDYGFTAANPFGRKAMTDGPDSKITVKKGETLRLRYGVFVYSAPKGGQVDLSAAYQEYLNHLGKD